MGKLNSALDVTGSLAGLIIYKRRDMDGTFVRQKPGPSGKKIKTLPAYDLVRKNNAEMGGRATATKWIRLALWPQKSLADYNFTPVLNSLMKPVQELDTVSTLGRRSVLFTKSNGLLNGFSLNRKTPFDSIIRNPVSFSVSKKTLSASVDIPALHPGINFFVPGKQFMYKLVAVLGVAPDLHYNGNRYAPANDYNMPTVAAETNWHPALTGSAGEKLEMKLTAQPPDEQFILLLSIGICFGNIVSDNHIQQQKYAGAAKILMCA